MSTETEGLCSHLCRYISASTRQTAGGQTGSSVGRLIHCHQLLLLPLSTDAVPVAASIIILHAQRTARPRCDLARAASRIARHFSTASSRRQFVPPALGAASVETH